MNLPESIKWVAQIVADGTFFVYKKLNVCALENMNILLVVAGSRRSYRRHKLIQCICALV